jgi:hypothetical protein
LNSESKYFSSADTLGRVEGNTEQVATGKICEDSAESKTQSMDGNFNHENREIPSVPRTAPEGNLQGRSANLSEGTADMNADGKSDDFVVPLTRTNKAATAVAEPAEERKSPKGSVTELSPMSQTLSWIWHQSEQHGKPRLVESLCDSIV